MDRGVVVTRKTYTLVGAGIGLLLFFALALVPAARYGGYAGALLAGGIVGTGVKTGAVLHGLTVFGMLLGLAGASGLFAVCGAIVGAAVAIVARAPAEAEAASGDAR